MHAPAQWTLSRAAGASGPLRARMCSCLRGPAGGLLNSPPKTLPSPLLLLPEELLTSSRTRALTLPGVLLPMASGSAPSQPQVSAPLPSSSFPSSLPPATHFPMTRCFPCSFTVCPRPPPQIACELHEGRGFVSFVRSSAGVGAWHMGGFSQYSPTGSTDAHASLTSFWLWAPEPSSMSPPTRRVKKPFAAGPIPPAPLAGPPTAVCPGPAESPLPAAFFPLSAPRSLPSLAACIAATWCWLDSLLALDEACSETVIFRHFELHLSL